VFDAEISDDRRFLLGQIAEVLESTEDALRWYGAVSDPARRLPAQLRIAVLHEGAKRPEQAIATLREVQTSDSEDGETLRNAFLLEGELLNRRGDLVASVDALNRGLQIFEDDRALLYARALTYERLDRVPEAIIDLQVLVAEDPEDADALNALGYTMADRTTDYEEALGYIERALALSPEQPAILDSMGWVLFKLGRAEEALDYLQRAFAGQRSQPTSPRCWPPSGVKARPARSGRRAPGSTPTIAPSSACASSSARERTHAGGPLAALAAARGPSAAGRLRTGAAARSR
jgi:tetratricopeptide (TPR) repeat protein